MKKTTTIALLAVCLLIISACKGRNSSSIQADTSMSIETLKNKEFEILENPTKADFVGHWVLIEEYSDSPNDDLEVLFLPNGDVTLKHYYYKDQDIFELECSYESSMYEEEPCISVSDKEEGIEARVFVMDKSRRLIGEITGNGIRTRYIKVDE